MAGLYIHIPFCASRCIYCGFYSTTHHELKQPYVDAVCREMELRHKESASPISTVYFGGGTPSQLSSEQLRQLFIYINKVYSITPDAEITIECNPDDVTPMFVATLQQLPINRVSMGTQTFDDNRLRFLHRRHTAAQVPVAVRRLRDAGIRNISIDLMYGFPGETIDDWQRDIDAALALNVEHLSAYCLMIEEGTPLFEIMHNAQCSMHNAQCTMLNEQCSMNNAQCTEELELAMYEMLTDQLTAAGYEHYEISNFAKLGYRSRHNSSYWQDVPYIGLGAAAHSYDGSCRQWNVNDIRQYIATIKKGEIPCEREVIDADTHFNDRITVALRTCEGLDLNSLTDKYRRYCLREAKRFLDDGLLRMHDNHLMLTRKGLFVSDYIMSSLVYV